MLLYSPVILDPADPTRNVAGSNPVGWWLLAEEAVAWLDYSCVKDSDMSPVCSWAVSVRRCHHSVPVHTSSVWRIFSNNVYLTEILHTSTVASFTAILAPFGYFTGWQDLTMGKPRAAHTDVLGLIPRTLW